jgi:hypothetical protein
LFLEGADEIVTGFDWWDFVRFTFFEVKFVTSVFNVQGGEIILRLAC